MGSADASTATASGGAVSTGGLGAALLAAEALGGSLLARPDIATRRSPTSASTPAATTTPSTTFRFLALPDRELIVEARPGPSSLSTARTTGADVVSSTGNNGAPSGGASADANGIRMRSAEPSVRAEAEGGRLSTSDELMSTDAVPTNAIARGSPEGGRLSISVDGGRMLSVGAAGGML
jgi:hypothetical protein